jgi:hypothetical protein
MAFKNLTSLELAVRTTSPAAAHAGLIKFYPVASWMHSIDAAGTVRDLVLDRPLEGFALTRAARRIGPADNVREAFVKLQDTFDRFELTGDARGSGAYNAQTGRYEIQVTLNGSTGTGPGSVAFIHGGKPGWRGPLTPNPSEA